MISTGNFNELTHVYTDHTLLTTDKDINAELLKLFHFLEKRVKPDGVNSLSFKTLLVAQFNMVDSFQKLVENEIKKAKKAGNGMIRLKLNNLEEPGMISLLYKAGKAGVKIQLLIRSICCLVPGIKEESENIQVKRLVDRYLEHTRLFIFGADHEAEIIMGSSDWMTRNLYYRIELCTPVNSPASRQELLDYFDLQWKDTDKATPLNSSIEYRGADNGSHNAQQSIYNYLKERV